MESAQDLVEMAAQIHDHERQGRDISAPWYHFEHADSDTVERLKTCTSESLELLNTLSRRLDEQLHADGGTNRMLQHAWHIVQELIQSRTASQEMLENILTDGAGYQEFYRALSLKEKAAEQQARQLKETLAH